MFPCFHLVRPVPGTNTHLPKPSVGRHGTSTNLLAARVGETALLGTPKCVPISSECPLLAGKWVFCEVGVVWGLYAYMNHIYYILYINTIYNCTTWLLWCSCYILLFFFLVAVVIFATTDADSPPDFWANTSHESLLWPPPSDDFLIPGDVAKGQGFWDD